MRINQFILVTVLCVGILSCNTKDPEPILRNTPVLPEHDWAKTAEIDILLAMNKQLTCWNNGDLVCFMDHYLQSDSLMFIGKSGVTYGWQATLDNYIKSYPDKRAMGELGFEYIKIKPIDKKNVYVIGGWHLKREDGDLSGHFTLLWEKLDGKHWVIVADHSS